MAGSGLVGSVVKALDILQLAAESPSSIRLCDIAERLEMKTPTAHNLVRTLISRNFLVKDRNKRLCIGPAFFELPGRRRRGELLNRAEKVMRRLSVKFPDAVITLGELAGTEIFCRRRMSPDRLGEMQKPMNQSFHGYASVTGVALYLFGSVDTELWHRRWNFEEHGIPIYGSREKFNEEVKRYRKLGRVERGYGYGVLMLAQPVCENFALGYFGEAATDGVRASVAEAYAAAAEEIAGASC